MMAKSKRITTALERLLDQVDPETGLRLADLVAARLTAMAVMGDLKAAALVLAYVDGRPMTPDPAAEAEATFAFDDFRRCIEDEAAAFLARPPESGNGMA